MDQGARDAVSIAQLTKQAREKFARTADALVSVNFNFLPDTTHHAALIDALERFQLWAGNIGAGIDAHRQISIEARLKEAPEVKRQICNLLYDLIDALDDLYAIAIGERENRTKDAESIELEVEDGNGALFLDTCPVDEAQDILCIISDCITGLMRLSIIIRKATTRDRWAKALQDREDRLDSQFDIRHVGQKFPKLDRPEQEWLKVRLGRAITQRRQFIRYCREHHEKLGAEELDVNLSAALENMQTAEPKETSSRVSSVARSNFTVPAPRVTQGSTKASTLQVAGLRDFQTKEEDDDLSIVSSVVSSLNIDGDTTNLLQLPSIQHVSQGKPEFECPFCFLIQRSGRQGKWKKHAFTDLKPYTCCAGKAECDLVMFADRNAWLDHELQLHRHEWRCLMCQSTPFRSLVPFRSHIKNKHTDVPIEQIPHLIQLSKQPLKLIPAADCPFRNDLDHRLRAGQAAIAADASAPDIILVDVQHFYKHVASHMEQLALFSIGASNSYIDNASLQDVFRDTKKQLHQLYETMIEHTRLSITHRNLFELIKNTQKLSRFGHPLTRTIGLVGESGVGKSSLINSLLDEDGIARSSGDGSACTSIVTEYRYLSSGRGENYYFEVDYMPSEEVKVVLEDLVSNCRDYHNNPDQFQTFDMSAEEISVKNKAERSAATLRSLFWGLPGYSENILSREGPDANREILVEFENMANYVQKQRPGGLTTSRYSATANTISDLTSQLDIFTRARSQDRLPIFWPFVSIIRIYSKSLILRTGLILADLPGLRDLDYARVRTTDKYIRSCHEVLVVARIDRATTDVGIREIVNQYGRHSLNIVCTHSETANARETEISSPKSAPRVLELQLTIDRLSRRLKQLTGLRNDHNQSPKRNSAEEEVSIWDELERAQSNLHEFLVQTRNAKVRWSLCEEYSNRVEGELHVFCVSNKDYSQPHGDELAIATQQVELSGIPELRRHCQSVSDAAQFRTQAAFIEHQVPTLLGSIRQWLFQESETLARERENTLRATINDAKSHCLQWSDFVSVLEQSLKGDFQITVLDPIGDGAAHWSHKAINVSQQWESWHWVTYGAFCRNFGQHSTASVGYQNWNDQIVLAMREDLAPAWAKFVHQASQRTLDIIRSIDQMMQTVKNVLTANNDPAPEAIRNLLANMGHRLSWIKELVHAALDKFLERIQRIQADAMEAYASSYISVLMRPVYVACMWDFGGRGSHNRQVVHMRKHLSGTSLFVNLGNLVRDSQWAATESIVKEIRDGLQANFDSLLIDIQSVVCEEDVLSESQQYPEAASLIQNMVDTLAESLEFRQGIVSQLREDRERRVK